jgi:hypothetical protein
MKQILIFNINNWYIWILFKFRFPPWSRKWASRCPAAMYDHNLRFWKIAECAPGLHACVLPSFTSGGPLGGLITLLPAHVNLVWSGYLTNTDGKFWSYLVIKQYMGAQGFICSLANLKSMSTKFLSVDSTFSNRIQTTHAINPTDVYINRLK